MFHGSAWRSPVPAAMLDGSLCPRKVDVSTDPGEPNADAHDHGPTGRADDPAVPEPTPDEIVFEARDVSVLYSGAAAVEGVSMDVAGCGSPH